MIYKRFRLNVFLPTISKSVHLYPELNYYINNKSTHPHPDMERYIVHAHTHTHTHTHIY